MKLSEKMHSNSPIFRNNPMLGCDTAVKEAELKYKIKIDFTERNYDYCLKNRTLTSVPAVVGRAILTMCCLDTSCLIAKC